jgi:hypothetical protein
MRQREDMTSLYMTSIAMSRGSGAEESCFKELATNPILLYHCQKRAEERRLAKKEQHYRPRDLDTSIMELRCEELKRQRDQGRHTSHFVIDDDAKPRYAYSLSMKMPKHHSQAIISWMLGDEQDDGIDKLIGLKAWHV